MEQWLILVLSGVLCIVLIVLLFLFQQLYMILTVKWNCSQVCLVGKTAIVTGSNIGIGYYTALDFAKRGARVILACRNQEKAEIAKSKIIETTGNQNVEVKIVDLSSLNSVRQFAKDVYATEPRLDILVNNAGAGCFPHSYSNDGLSLTMQINHFGPFLLTVLLLDLLKKSAPSRIVTISSCGAAFGHINISNLNAPSKFFTRIFDYNRAKLCTLYFTIKLAEILKGTRVTINAVHPGAIQTDYLKNKPDLLTKFFGIIVKLLFMRTEAGAQTPVYVAIAKELDEVSGKYFVKCSETPLPRAARNDKLATLLWNKSEELVKLTPEEKSSVRSCTQI